MIVVVLLLALFALRAKGSNEVNPPLILFTVYVKKSHRHGRKLKSWFYIYPKSRVVVF